MKYIVVRNCPSSWVGLDGRWFILKPNVKALDFPTPEGTIWFGPTGRFEIREDGIRAEIYEPDPALDNLSHTC